MSNNARRINRKAARTRKAEITKKLLTVTCPECGKRFKVGAKNKNDANGATFDCKHCDALLIMTNRRVRNFHEYMHEQLPQWPVDGSGTYFMEVSA